MVLNVQIINRKLMVSANLKLPNLPRSTVLYIFFTSTSPNCLPFTSVCILFMELWHDWWIWVLAETEIWIKTVAGFVFHYAPMMMWNFCVLEMKGETGSGGSKVFPYERAPLLISHFWCRNSFLSHSSVWYLWLQSLQKNLRWSYLIMIW